MNSFVLRFSVPEVPFIAEKALTLELAEGVLTVGVYYTADPRPLVLTAAAQVGDAAELRVRPHRIELWVGGEICDEEWPWGEHFLTEEALSGLEMTALEEETEELPAVTGEFEEAEGWQPEPSVFVGDCMPYCDGERYHVLYLKDRHRHASKWGKGAHQWAHISTADLRHWQQHPLAVEITEPWEGSICTGSWMELDGVHYLYYTVRTVDGSPAPLRRSVSRDGYHYRKDAGFSFILSERYHAASARDPKVVRAADGSYHMFVTTSLRESGRGCLAHLVSDDLETWTELGSIYVSPDESQPECPDYFALNGWHYLIFSHHGKGEYRYSRAPFSDWMTPAQPVIPCKSVPKMAIFDGRILFAGFDGQGKYAGTMTFLEMQQREDGTLSPI